MKLRYIREANIARLPQFRDAKGRRAHSEDDGSDWSLAEWLQAVTGELGELANVLKKVKRGDFTMADAHEQIGHELADTLLYLDILAFRCGVDLEQVTMDKFNIVSRRVKSTIRLAPHGVRYNCDPEE